MWESKFSDEIKKQVLDRIRAGESMSSVARDVGIHTGTIQYWKQRAGMTKSSGKQKPKDLFAEAVTPIEMTPELRAVCNQFVDAIKSLLMSQIFNNIKL